MTQRVGKNYSIVNSICAARTGGGMLEWKCNFSGLAVKEAIASFVCALQSTF
jgi:hypothetical protein